MTEPAASENRKSERDWTSIALLGVVFAYVVFNSVLAWTAPSGESDDPVALLMVLGVAVLQPLAIGVWTALGAGSILTRLPIAIPCVALLLVVPAHIRPLAGQIDQVEFRVYVIAAFAIWAVSIIVFLVFRWFTGFRIQSARTESNAESDGLKFSIRYLLVLTTLYAIVLGLATQIKFQSPSPPGGFSFGTGFMVVVVAFGGSLAAVGLLPMLAVPLAVLHGQPSSRAIKWVAVLWLVITIAITIFTIDQENPFVILGALLAAQFAAVVVGALTALFLRRFGLRLIRPNNLPDSAATT